MNFTPSANSSVACKGSKRVVGKDEDLSTVKNSLVELCLYLSISLRHR